MGKYLGYTRQSKDGNSENTFSMQKKSIISFAKSKGLEISSEDIYEEGKSAYWKKKNGEEDRGKRKEFISLYDILKKESKKDFSDREYVGAIFFDVSRIARNRHDFYELENLMDDGIEILSTSENLNDSAMGRYCFRMMQSESIFYSDRQSSKMTRYNVLSVTENPYKSTGSLPPFGYDVDSALNIVRHKVNSDIVKRIFDLKAEKNYLNKTVVEILKNEFSNRVDKYNKSKKGDFTKASIPNEKKISEITNNNYSIKYNGIREYNFTVNFKDDIDGFSYLLNKKNLVDKKFQIKKGENKVKLDCLYLEIVPERKIKKIIKKSKRVLKSKHVYSNFLECECGGGFSGNKGKYVKYGCVKSSVRAKKNPTCENNSDISDGNITEYITNKIIPRLDINLNNKELFRLLDLVKKSEIKKYKNGIRTLKGTITRYNNNILPLKNELKNKKEDEEDFILRKISSIKNKIADNNFLIDDLKNKIDDMNNFLDKKINKLIKCAYGFNQITQEDKEWFLDFIGLKLILGEDKVDGKKYKNPQDRSKNGRERYQKIAKIELHPFFQNIYNKSLKNQYEEGIRLCQDQLSAHSNRKFDKRTVVSNAEVCIKK